MVRRPTDEWTRPGSIPTPTPPDQWVTLGWVWSKGDNPIQSVVHLREGRLRQVTGVWQDVAVLRSYWSSRVFPCHWILAV